jgi:thioredoxin 1
MAITVLDKSNFNEITSRDGIVMVDCWAEWCGACKEFNPIYEKVANDFSAHMFTKLDTTAEKEIVKAMGIDHIPALMLFRDGILLFKQPGYYEEDKLRDIIHQAEGIDMDEVRAHMEAENDEEMSDSNSG